MEQYQKAYVLGVSEFQKGNYKEAIIHIEQAISLAKLIGLNTSDETYETGYFNLAQANKLIGNLDKAIDYYKKALFLNPKRENTYIHMSECCFEVDTLESMNTAIDILKMSATYFPNNASTYINLGIAFIKIGKREQAKEALTVAKKLGNTDADGFIKDYCN